MGAEPIGSHGHYEKMTFKVPAAVAHAARHGLALREKCGTAAYKERTKVGAKRARQLSSGRPTVTLRDIVFMRSYFRRHAVDLRGQDFDPKCPTNGWISWLLWGGTAGSEWAERLYHRHLGMGA